MSLASTTPPPAGPFWTATAELRLDLSFCPDCAAARWYPEPRCPACGSSGEPSWRPVAGSGTVVTWTRVHRPFVPTTGDGPVLIGLVELDEAPGARLVVPLEVPGRDPEIGERVVVRFTPIDGHTLPVFRPVAA